MDTRHIAEAWSRAADQWDEHHRALEQQSPEAVGRALAHVVSQLAVPAGSRVLDAGCGSGNWCVRLARRGFTVCGLDVAPGMLALAARNAGQTQAAAFVLGDMAAMPFRGGAFDAAISFSALDFVPDPVAALREFARVLRPDSRLLLGILGAASPVKTSHYRRFLGEETPFNGMLPWELEQLLGDLGWTILDEQASYMASIDGVPNPIGKDAGEALPHRLLRQTAATAWRVLARRPG